MEVKENFKMRNDKGGRKKVKCSLFFSASVNRELAIHEDQDSLGKTAVSDVVTGVRFFSIPTEIVKTTMDQVHEKLDKFVAHYTLDSIKEKLREFENLDSLTLNDKK